MTEHNNQQDCKSHTDSHNRPEMRIRITSKILQHLNIIFTATATIRTALSEAQILYHSTFAMKTDTSKKFHFLYTQEREWKSIHTVAIKSSIQTAKNQDEHNYNLNETKYSLFYQRQVY